MGRRNDHSKEELERLILDNAYEIIGSEGLEALTARRLAKDIGYAPGTIYNLFHSMDDLILLAQGRTLDRLYGLLSSSKCTSDNASPSDNIKKMAITYADFAYEHHNYWQALFSPKNPEDRDARNWYISKIEKLFIPLEAQLLRELGEEHKDLAKKAAKLIWSSVHGLVITELTSKVEGLKDSPEPSENYSYLIDVLLNGLKA